MAALRFYFHTETALQGAPATPTGSLTLSEVAPDQTDAAAASIAGGHTSTSSGAAAAQLNKPTTKDNTTVVGEAPTTNPPAAAHQFGWFTDLKYRGTFATGNWTIVFREDDNRALIVGHGVVNLYANKTRDFASPIRFIAQWHGASTDWWTGGASAIAAQSESINSFNLADEYLIVQLWCHETSGFSAAKTLTFHQEGSDLVDTTRSNILTPVFSPTPFAPAIVLPNQAVKRAAYY